MKPALTAKRHQNDTELEENRIEVVQKRAEKGITIHLTCITSGFKRNTTNILFFNLSFPPTIIVMGRSTKADYIQACCVSCDFKDLGNPMQKSYFYSRGKEFYASGSGSTLFLLYFYLYLLCLVSCVEAQFCFFVEERRKEFVSF